MEISDWVLHQSCGYALLFAIVSRNNSTCMKNHSPRDAWELFQSTGIESLIAYDCSGAVLLMGTILGGLITETSVGIWTWLMASNHIIMVSSTTMLMGMILVGLTLVVVESAVTSIYICYVEDPSLINRWDEAARHLLCPHTRLGHKRV